MREGSSARVSSSSFSEAHVAVVEAVDYFLDALGEKKREYLNQIFDLQYFPDELNEAMATLGLFGTLIPQNYGGNEAGLLAMVLAMERFASYGLGNTLALLITMDTLAILLGGGQQQKETFLPKIASGQIKTAFAITEPDAGTNTFELKLSATSQRDGQSYLLNGTKAWITGVDRVDYILVVSRTTPLDEVSARGLSRSFGLTLFMVPAQITGLEKTKMNTVGVEGYSQFQLYFDNVEISKDMAIGEIDQGAGVLFSALNPERIVAASMSVGSVDYFLNKAANYAKERKVFGNRSIAHYQSLQHPLARVRAQQEGARLITYEAAKVFDRREPAHVVGSYSNMAKYLSSEVACDAIDRSIQAHGGMGFILDTGLIQMLASTRLAKTAPINNEMILNYIAETELDLPRSY